MLPEGWKNKTLGELTNEKLSYGANSSSIEIDRSNLRYIRITDIDDQGNLSNDAVGIDPIEGSAYILKNNDFLFARSGNTVGKTFLYCEKSHPPSAYAGYLIRYRPNSDKLLPIYLKHFCLSDTYHSWVKSQIRAGAQPNINAKEYASLSLPIPPLPEQKKIAQILSTWDNAISATERLLENSQQRKKGLMQQLLTGTTYAGLSGKTKEDFGTGEPFVTYMGVFSDGSIKTDRFDFVRLSEGESQNKVQYGDILFTTSSETPEEVGMASVLLEYLPYNLYLNSFCFGFRPSSFEELVPEYARYVFRGEEMRRRISALAQGATRYNLSKKQLVKLDILLPGKAEQEAISQVLATSDMEISAVRHRLVYLREEKKALMQQLLTGKRRVQVDTEAA